MSPTDIVKDDWVCMFAAECQQPPVQRTTATHHSHGHLSVQGYDDEDDDEDEDEDDSDDIYLYTG